MVLTACRYTGVDTTWDRSLHIEGVANFDRRDCDFNQSVERAGALCARNPYCNGVSVAHVSRSAMQRLVCTAETGYRYIWYQQVIRLGTAMTIVADTLLSWTLLVQVRACAGITEYALSDSPAGCRHRG